MKFSQIAVAVALSAASLAASAQTTFTATQYNWGDSVVVSFGSETRSRLTAEIIGTFDPAPAGSFAAFCVELDRNFSSPFTGLFISPLQATALSTLINGAGWKSNDWQNDSIGSAASIAALQVGIWDIVYDGSINLAAGAFQVDATAQAAYGTILSDWMTAGENMEVKTYMPSDLLQLSDGHGQRGEIQDILVAVPEPSTYALMIAGLGAIGFVARRRARRG